MQHRKIKPRILTAAILLAVLIGSVVYNIYDNQRFIVVEQTVTLERLPASFDGFKILQISDLHGKSFGADQAVLIAAVNGIDYDMIAFTGDMNNSTDMVEDRASSKAILDLLDGLENKEYLFWIDGNAGPHAVENLSGVNSGGLKEIGIVLQEKGCKILTLPVEIQRGNDTIWITPPMSEIQLDGDRAGIESRLPGDENYERAQSFYETAYAAFQAIKGNGDVKIMLDHVPAQTNMTDEALQPMGILDYDLILAGHYHGGQWRLPLIGAVYVPSPTLGINNSGFFPDQRAVKGWSKFGSVPQYVSAGLGASGHPAWASFRLFNTPEINLITLKSQ